MVFDKNKILAMVKQMFCSNEMNLNGLLQLFIIIRRSPKIKKKLSVRYPSKTRFGLESPKILLPMHIYSAHCEQHGEICTTRHVTHTHIMCMSAIGQETRNKMM